LHSARKKEIAKSEGVWTSTHDIAHVVAHDVAHVVAHDVAHNVAHAEA
jgi:hypothetical protein